MAPPTGKFTNSNKHKGLHITFIKAREVYSYILNETYLNNRGFIAESYMHLLVSLVPKLEEEDKGYAGKFHINKVILIGSFSLIILL